MSRGCYRHMAQQHDLAKGSRQSGIVKWRGASDVTLVMPDQHYSPLYPSRQPSTHPASLRSPNSLERQLQCVHIPPNPFQTADPSTQLLMHPPPRHCPESPNLSQVEQQLQRVPIARHPLQPPTLQMPCPPHPRQLPVAHPTHLSDSCSVRARWTLKQTCGARSGQPVHTQCTRPLRRGGCSGCWLPPFPCIGENA